MTNMEYAEWMKEKQGVKNNLEKHLYLAKFMHLRHSELKAIIFSSLLGSIFVISVIVIWRALQHFSTNYFMSFQILPSERSMNIDKMPHSLEMS